MKLGYAQNIVSVGDEEIQKSFLLDTWLNVGSNDLNWSCRDITGLLRAVILTYFSVESFILAPSYQNPECARNMTFSSNLQGIQKSFGKRDGKLKENSNSKSCSCWSKFLSILPWSCNEDKCPGVLLIRLKTEYIIYQNVVLTSKTPGKSMSCVGQSTVSGLARIEDFSRRRLGDRWIKYCCYLSTKFAFLLTKELVFDVL